MSRSVAGRFSHCIDQQDLLLHRTPGGTPLPPLPLSLTPQPPGPTYTTTNPGRYQPRMISTSYMPYGGGGRGGGYICHPLEQCADGVTLQCQMILCFQAYPWGAPLVSYHPLYTPMNKIICVSLPGGVDAVNKCLLSAYS